MPKSLKQVMIYVQKLELALIKALHLQHLLHHLGLIHTILQINMQMKQISKDIMLELDLKYGSKLKVK